MIGKTVEFIEKDSNGDSVLRMAIVVDSILVSSRSGCAITHYVLQLVNQPKYRKSNIAIVHPSHIQSIL